MFSTMSTTVAAIAALTLFWTPPTGGADTIDRPDLNGQPVPTLQEDDPGWDCIMLGNHVCGPGNATGAVAGCYDDTGALVTAWPCFVVTNPDGSADVFTPDARP